MLGIGTYLPQNIVSAEEINRRAGLSPGWTETHSGVLTRHFVADETASWMGARAVERALADAGLALHEVDCIVCTSGTMEQPIPCTAALIQEQLGAAARGIPSFDINSTCLSFLTGLDTLSYLVAAGRYQHVVLVASEIASLGLDWEDPESCSILGDGAAAVVIGQPDEQESSRILTARMETYAAGAHLAEIRGGGSALHGRHYTEATRDNYLFHMEGKAVFRMASEILPAFIERLFTPAKLAWADFDLVIPHQASLAALQLTRRRLGIPEERFLMHAEKVGNTIAASIPMGLFFAREQNRLHRGDRILLLGTSAGFSVGAVALEF
jgi:3-oxoacyl-[acyl-carrier-protein] synthase III